jgi:hypothetical protein
MSELIPLAYDTHPDYYDLNIPDPVVTQDAEKFMDWLNWQQSMVPKVFQGEPWAIYDLEAYQAFISDYISVKAEEENGKSIYTQDGPFITGEIKESLR